MRDPYTILGVRRTATQDEIKVAWRTAAKAVHPDQNQDDPEAVNRFTEIGRAYDILKDPEKRRAYDKAAEAALNRRKDQTFMEQRMRAEEEARRRAAQAQAEAEADHAQAQETAEDIIGKIFGARKARQASEQARAQADGTTGRAWEPDDFPEEDNFGTAGSRSPARDLFSYLVKALIGQPAPPEKAPDLATTHWISVEDLHAGRHQTLVLADGRSVGFDLPDGATEGTAIRIEGQGHRLAGMKRGDLVVELRVKHHPFFRVEKHNLVTFHPVDIENAVLGCETTVETLSGNRNITIPEWSGSDQIVLVEGEGLRRDDGTRGDLIVELRVMLWDFPDQKVVDLMRSLREGLFL